MAQNIGTLITAAIRPNDSLDPIASAFAKEIKGGLHTATSSSDRDSIIVQRREWGMMCYVINDDALYQLKYNYVDTNITNNSNWVVFSGGGSGGGEWVDSVLSRLTTPPGSPTNGDRYLINTGAGGAWTTQDGRIAQWDGVVMAWVYTTPTDGMSVRVDNEDNSIYRYEGVYPSGTWEKELVSQVRYISATSSDTYQYTAASTPDFASYDTSTLFLVTFATANGGSSSLNVNGLGDVVIRKPAGTGSSYLSPGDISSGSVYTLLYDGSYFQLDIPTVDITYTNATPVPTTIGGIDAGTTFSNVTMQQMWDMLLYPYQSPNFTSFTFNYGTSPKEVGDSILAGTYTFTWGTSFPANVSPNTITITDVTNANTLLTGGANDGTENISLPLVQKLTPATHQWSIGATRTNASTMNSSLTISWLWRRYYGNQASTSLTASQIQSLSNSGLVSTGNGNYTFAGGGYKYFAWPTSFPTPSLFRDFNTNLAVAMAGVAEGYTTAVGSYYAQTVSVTNVNGVTTNYYVFRSLNILGGAITIVVT